MVFETYQGVATILVEVAVDYILILRHSYCHISQPAFYQIICLGWSPSAAGGDGSWAGVHDSRRSLRQHMLDGIFALDRDSLRVRHSPMYDHASNLG